VEPWAGTTGSFAAQIYCGAIEITSTFHHLLGNVEIAGYGPLFAAPGRQTFLNMRHGWITGDYGQFGAIARATTMRA
jgi:hypothetical protein